MKKFLKVLKHVFVPHRGNAFRPHAFRHKMLSIYSIGLMLSQLAFGITLYSGPNALTVDAKTFTNNIIAETNSERQSQKIGNLYESEVLDKAAADKLKDMFDNDYWDHTGPQGQTAWDFMQHENYTYVLAGENLARGFINTKETVAAWMASPTHRANILNNQFKEIGVAVGSGKINGNLTTLIVQLFGEPKTAFASASSTQNGAKEVMPSISLGNASQPSKVPFFMVWILIFSLIVVDGFMIRRLGLHASRSHMFNFRVSLLMATFGLAILLLGFVGIA